MWRSARKICVRLCIIKRGVCLVNGSKVTAVIMAAGKSERLGFDKLFYKLNKKPLLWHTVNAFENAACIDDIVLVCNGQNLSSVSALCAGFKKISAITLGGAQRMHSVRRPRLPLRPRLNRPTSVSCAPCTSCRTK